MLDAFLSLLLVTFFLLATPGPATLALAATGAMVGVRAGLPFLLGILFGLAVVIAGVSLGLAVLLNNFPPLKLAMQLVAALYVCYLAYKIATAPLALDASIDKTKIPNFRDGFIANISNPKAYAAFFAIFAQFMLPFDSPLLAVMATSLTCFLLAAIIDFGWLSVGSVLQPVFSRPRLGRILRCAFALLMLAAVILAMLAS